MVVAGEGSAGLQWSLLVRDVFVAPFWPVQPAATANRSAADGIRL
jgi:hypothetical protein